MSHHSSMDLGPNDPDADQRKAAMSKMMEKLLGEHPDGKLNKDDEGAVAVAIAHHDGKVIIDFPKPVKWIGFTPEQAVEIAGLLVEHARACGCSKPLEVKIG